MTNSTNSQTEIEEILRKKFQFCHHNCPADTVIDGYDDLRRCTCHIESAIHEAIAAINQLLVKARLDEISSIPHITIRYLKQGQMQRIEDRYKELRSQLSQENK